MEIRKILWPTDFSENSNAALPYVLSLSKKYGAEIYLLYAAVDPIGYDHPPWYGELENEHARKLRDWEVPHAKKRMGEICERELQGCPLFHKMVVVGDPADEILKAVKKEGIDIIVMSTRGRKGQFPFGSVTEKIVKNAPVPVWTVPK